jgi:lysophospholipase L1-like esterase
MNMKPSLSNYKAATAILIFYFVLMSACSKATVNVTNTRPVVTDTTHNTTTPADTSALTWLALGDSYTIGQSVDSSQRYPAQTAILLQTYYIKHVSGIQYIAKTGWTTSNLQSAINVAKLGGPFDIVTLLIGVNDQYQGIDTAVYRTRFTQLLQQALQFAGNNKMHVFVLSIPDYSVTPFGGGSAAISKDLSYFNAINKTITAAYNINYIDITGISLGMGTDASLVANDGLHPSGKEYNMWANELAASIATSFK